MEVTRLQVSQLCLITQPHSHPPSPWTSQTLRWAGFPRSLTLLGPRLLCSCLPFHLPQVWLPLSKLNLYPYFPCYSLSAASSPFPQLWLSLVLRILNWYFQSLPVSQILVLHLYLPLTISSWTSYLLISAGGCTVLLSIKHVIFDSSSSLIFNIQSVSKYHSKRLPGFPLPPF